MEERRSIGGALEDRRSVGKGWEEAWKRVEIECGRMADVRQEIRENVDGDEGRSIDFR